MQSPLLRLCDINIRVPGITREDLWCCKSSSEYGVSPLPSLFGEQAGAPFPCLPPEYWIGLQEDSKMQRSRIIPGYYHERNTARARQAAERRAKNRGVKVQFRDDRAHSKYWWPFNSFFIRIPDNGLRAPAEQLDFQILTAENGWEADDTVSALCRLHQGNSPDPPEFFPCDCAALTPCAEKGD